MKCGVMPCVLVRCLQECREQVSSAQTLEWKNLDIPALDLKSQHTTSRCSCLLRDFCQLPGDCGASSRKRFGDSSGSWH